VKYTTTGHIYFNISSVRDKNTIKLIISVEDTGLGIKEENIHKLFNKFERLGVEKNTTTEGTGLGLAITKKLVELMNGKIFLQSIYGVGSRFKVLIDQGIVSGEELEKIKTLQVKTTASEKMDVVGKKVLIVDDNTLNLKVAERLLKKYNLNIESISSGLICLEKINQGSTYDLILMDDMMPHMTGIETLHKLKENQSFNIPIVVLTANAISGMREKYLEEGFDDYLSKPIEKEELNRVIKRYLS
jgi:CheY-like chemotaxis protein